MANFITKSFSADAGSLVEAVGKAVDKEAGSDDERQERESELRRADQQFALEEARLSIEGTRLAYADIANARENQSRVQEAAGASWLSKNVHPLLAMSIIGLTFGMYFAIATGSGWVDLQDSGMKDIIIYILGALTTVSTQVASYFFGSSQGSKDSQLMLHDLTSKSMQRGVRRGDPEGGSSRRESDGR